MAASSAPAPSSPSSLRVTGALLAAAVALWGWLVIAAPDDAAQGVVQKILYVHVPVVLGAYLGFIVTAVCGALYLWRGDVRFDRVAAASAEVGVVFCTLVLVTGPIWGKGTWGKWWSWDLRLTLTVLLWFLYVAYLLLRSFTEGSERAARFSAVYGILGVLVIPVNYFAIDLASGRTMHPENLERDSLGPGMGWPFAVGMLTAALAYLHLLRLRLQVESLRTRQHQAEARELEALE